MPQGGVLPQRRSHQQSLALAVLGHVAQAHQAPLAHRLAGEVGAQQGDGAGVGLEDAQHGAHQLGLAVALHAGHPDDLAPVDSQAHAVHHGAVLIAHGEALDHQGGLVGDGGLPGVGDGQLRADHHLGQVVGGRVAGVHRAHGPALAQHGDGVGDLEHLVELVVDEQDGGAGRLELAHVAEQLVHLLGDQHRGGLVEDEDLRPPVEHLDDLDPLALAHLQGLHQVVGVDVEAVGPAHLVEMVPGRLEVDPAEGAHRLGPQDDVLQHGELVGQHEVLVDHADAQLYGPGGRAQLHPASSEADGPRVGGLHPVEDLHQGRLARPVLAADGVDLAGGDGEVDAVVGHDPREPLGDAPQLYGRRVAGGGVRGCRFRRAGGGVLDRRRISRFGRVGVGVRLGRHETASRQAQRRACGLRGLLRLRRSYGSVGTVMAPELIWDLYSSSWSAMSSMKPPEVL